jgi:hypothetical protein
VVVVVALALLTISGGMIASGSPSSVGLTIVGLPLLTVSIGMIASGSSIGWLSILISILYSILMVPVLF